MLAKLIYMVFCCTTMHGLPLDDEKPSFKILFEYVRFERMLEKYCVYDRSKNGHVLAFKRIPVNMEFSPLYGNSYLESIIFDWRRFYSSLSPWKGLPRLTGRWQATVLVPSNLLAGNWISGTDMTFCNELMTLHALFETTLVLTRDPSDDQACIFTRIAAPYRLNKSCLAGQMRGFKLIQISEDHAILSSGSPDGMLIWILSRDNRK